jgi:tetratricopeptide (TPR) repeat protein
VAARLPVPGDETVQEKVLHYNEEARNFRKQGDFGLAEAALGKALELKPGDSMTLISLAMLREAKGDKAAALETWKQVLAILPPGDSTLARARERAKLLEEGLRLDSEAKAREELMVKSGQRRIVIENIRTTPSPLPPKVSDAQIDFTLRIADSDPKFDPSALRIQVFVYNRTGDGKLEPAKIEARFLNAQPDWKPGGTEVLRTAYFRPLDDKSDRAYYGYLIRIYYGDELQDQRAEPRELLDLVAGKGP